MSKSPIAVMYTGATMSQPKNHADLKRCLDKSDHPYEPFLTSNSSRTSIMEQLLAKLRAGEKVHVYAACAGVMPAVKMLKGLLAKLKKSEQGLISNISFLITEQGNIGSVRDFLKHRPKQVKTHYFMCDGPKHKSKLDALKKASNQRGNESLYLYTHPGENRGIFVTDYDKIKECSDAATIRQEMNSLLVSGEALVFSFDKTRAGDTPCLEKYGRVVVAGDVGVPFDWFNALAQAALSDSDDSLDIASHFPGEQGVYKDLCLTPVSRSWSVQRAGAGGGGGSKEPKAKSRRYPSERRSFSVERGPRPTVTQHPSNSFEVGLGAMAGVSYLLCGGSLVAAMPYLIPSMLAQASTVVASTLSGADFFGGMLTLAGIMLALGIASTVLSVKEAKASARSVTQTGAGASRQEPDPHALDR